MIKVHRNLFIGNGDSCKFYTTTNTAVIHACKHPCHVNAVGYEGNLSQGHPYYLTYEKGKHLFLNMVDMEREFHPKFTHPMMVASIRFIKKHIVGDSVLIHCNQGLSRSPSIALVYLAIIKEINSQSFQQASQGFKEKYPDYLPGKGISAYLAKNWIFLMSIE